MPQIEPHFGLLAMDALLLTSIVIASVVLLRWLVGWLIDRRTSDVRLRYRSKKLATYTANALGIFLTGSIWFAGFQSLGTFLGLLTAGLAVALKDVITSVAGWFYILSRKPFSVGDRIAIGDQAGDVIDQRLFRFSLLEIGNWVDADQSTGRVIHIPNSLVFTQTIANYTAGFAYIWNEVPVLITFESDWRKAKRLIQEIGMKRCSQVTDTVAQAISRAARSQMIVYSKLDPRVWTRVGSHGILLTLRYLCDPRQRRGTEEQIWEDVLDAFSAARDIDFAYPTMRRYINPEEGKPGTGGPATSATAELAEPAEQFDPAETVRR